MKEELEKLGFEYCPQSYYLIIKDIIIEIYHHNNIVSVNNTEEYKGYLTELFPYNLEKLKQLIKLLS